MKTTRDIYKRLRDLKFHYLTKFYKKYTRKIPENCLYNDQYNIGLEKGVPITIGLCLLHQPDPAKKEKVYPHLIEICHEPSHCVNCNAFVFKYSKENIKELFELELSDKENVIKKYPDIHTLEWVLEGESMESKSFFKRIIKIVRKLS